jgi:hypothetical protein
LELKMADLTATFCCCIPTGQRYCCDALVSQLDPQEASTVHQSMSKQFLMFWLGLALSLAGCSGVGVKGQVGYTIHWDFENGVGPEWSTDRTHDLENNKILGIFNDRNQKFPNGATLTIDNIPPNTPVHLAFDLYFIGSWDSGGPLADRWTLSIKGGDTLMDMTSFDYGLQNGKKVLTAGVRGLLDTGRRKLPYHTVTNELTIKPDQIPQGGKLVLDFRGYVTGHGTEFWALDNVSLTIGNPR